jgi:hypothetical protein
VTHEVQPAEPAVNETDLLDEVNRDWNQMSLVQRRLWEVIKIPPQKWQQHPWGDAVGGFWVVAILGSTVVWFNDIEEGFNRSRYDRHGVIRDYWCNQDELGMTMQCLLDEIASGNPRGTYLGPPEPLPNSPASAPNPPKP